MVYRHSSARPGKITGTWRYRRVSKRGYRQLQRYEAALARQMKKEERRKKPTQPSPVVQVLIESAPDKCVFRYGEATITYYGRTPEEATYRVIDGPVSEHPFWPGVTR